MRYLYIEFVGCCDAVVVCFVCCDFPVFVARCLFAGFVVACNGFWVYSVGFCVWWHLYWLFGLYLYICCGLDFG